MTAFTIWASASLGGSIYSNSASNTSATTGSGLQAFQNTAGSLVAIGQVSSSGDVAYLYYAGFDASTLSGKTINSVNMVLTKPTANVSSDCNLQVRASSFGSPLATTDYLTVGTSGTLAASTLYAQTTGGTNSTAVGGTFTLTGLTAMKTAVAAGGTFKTVINTDNQVSSSPMLFSGVYINTANTNLQTAQTVQPRLTGDYSTGATNATLTTIVGTATASGGTSTLTGVRNGTVTTVVGTATAAGATSTLTGTSSATLTTVVGTATAAGGTSTLSGVQNNTLTTVVGTATASGATSTLTATSNATLTTVQGQATASGGTSTLTGTSAATLSTTTGTATASGGTSTLSSSSSATLTTLVGAATAAGGTSTLTAIRNVTLTTLVALATASGNQSLLTGTTVNSRGQMTGSIRTTATMTGA